MKIQSLIQSSIKTCEVPTKDGIWWCQSTFSLFKKKPGFLVDLISSPVMSGFCSAAALTVFTTQVKGLTGLKFSGSSFVKVGWVNVSWTRLSNEKRVLFSSCDQHLSDQKCVFFISLWRSLYSWLIVLLSIWNFQLETQLLVLSFSFFISSSNLSHLFFSTYSQLLQLLQPRKGRWKC